MERVVSPGTRLLPRRVAGDWPGRLASRLTGFAARRLTEHASGLASRVRVHGFGRYSDAELKAALVDVRYGKAASDALPRVFGIVDVAVSRRLGAWRVFAPDFDHPLRDVARSVVALGPYRADPAYCADISYLDSAAFRRAVEAAVAERTADTAEREIVWGMVYVAEKGRAEYGTNIHLPARFYEALAARDPDGVLRLRATDEQLRAGELLYRGRVVEMEAGEGKTIAAAFPAVLHATLGRRVHVITANDYLALRDAEWLAPVYESLGLTVRAVLGSMEDAERREAYRADVVYGTVRELGFDFLRDNLRYSTAEMVQCGLDVAIVDEADQALVDESQTPLIISGGAMTATRSVHRADKAVSAVIAAQREMVRSVEAELRGAGLGPKRLKTLLVRLTLAAPRSEVLARILEGDGRLRESVRAAARASASPDADDTAPLEGLYYHVDLEHGLVTLTDPGHRFIEGRLGPVFDTRALEAEIEEVRSSYDVPLGERRAAVEGLSRRLSRRHGQMNQVHQALTAHLLLRRDEDYVVTEGTVVLVDGPTGRARPDSRYQHGLQSALEAKERVRVHRDSEVIGQISIQGYMRQYRSVAGMTGTALDAQDELRREYGLRVAAVPPSHRSRRVDWPARVYRSRRDKLSALVDEVRRWNLVGRPVLVGTVTVEQSEEVSAHLTRHGISHRVLNAVRNAEEAEIVRSAGRFGAVTVATNMAGRGTDILLDPDLDSRTAVRCAEMVTRMLDGGANAVRVECATPEEADILEAALESVGGLHLSRANAGSGTGIVASRDSARFSPTPLASIEFGCGLHVIGTEMNDSARVDAQLRGRAGRQGAHGSSRYLLSLEDRILAVSGIGSLPESDTRLDIDGRPFHEGISTTRVLDRGLSRMEQDTATGRAIMSDYQRVLEEQTLAYYRARREVIAADRFHATCIVLAQETAGRLVGRHFPPTWPGSYAVRFDELAEEVWLDYGVDCRPLWGLGAEALSEEIGQAVAGRLSEAREAVGADVFDTLERVSFLQTADERWRVHLDLLDGMTAAAMLFSQGHRTAVADFSARCREAYAGFRQNVIDGFVPRLLDAASDHGDEVDTLVEMGGLAELQAILA